MKRFKKINFLLDFFVVYFILHFLMKSSGNFSFIYCFVLPLIIAGFKVFLFYILGIYNALLQFWGIYETKIFLLPNLIGSFVILIILSFKISIFFIEYIVTSVIILFIRYIEKYIILTNFVIRPKFKHKESKKMNAIIIGAGEAGFMTLREIKRHPESNIEIVGFIDDSPEKQEMRVCGKKIFGKRDKIPQIVKEKNIDLIILAIPSAPPGERKRILEICEKLNVYIKIVPSTIEIIKGDVKYEQIRDIKIEDLLGREEISLDTNTIAKYIKNKSILITGAGGSIGSEIARQVVRFSPKKVILLGKGENSIFNINMELSNEYSSISIYPVVADIRDKIAIEDVFKKFKPDVVFHSAAHKHVYLMELYPTEAFKNNVIGTLNLAELAVKYNVKRFVLISTDKAVYPKSVMGITKRIAENVVLGFMQTEKNKNTKFIVVRFGNVFASRGSVIPIFQQQIERGGPVTVTHPNVVRYFMTIPEAVQLVLQASALGKGGEIFILDMGKPIKISDIAKKMIKLSGYEPGKDIKIKYIGLKPGEKLKEELFEKDEKVEKTKYEKILKAVPLNVNFKLLIREIKKGEEIISNLSKKESVKFLKNLLKR